MKRKKLMAAGMAALLTFSCLAGCGGTATETASAGGASEEAVESSAAPAQESSADQAAEAESSGSGEVVTIRMWGGVPPESGPQQVCDNFNELYKDKGIQVEYERFVNDETGNLKLETNLLSGTGVDLYMSYGIDALTKRAQGEMALDLTELMERDGFDQKAYFGDMAEAYYVDGKPYCLPTKLDQYGIVINKTMFDEAGIEVPTEWTFEEFREIAKQLTHGEGQDKVYGIFWNTQQDISGMFNYLIAQTNGGDPMYLSETETAFEDPVVLQAVQLVNDMMNVDGTSPTHTDSVTQKLSQEGLFLTGKCAMTIGPWMIDPYCQSSPCYDVPRFPCIRILPSPYPFPFPPFSERASHKAQSILTGHRNHCGQSHLPPHTARTKSEAQTAPSWQRFLPHHPQQASYSADPGSLIHLRHDRFHSHFLYFPELYW